MAIVFDTSTDGGRTVAGTTLTFAHTCNGTNRILWVEVYTLTTTTPTSVTYAAIAMTKQLSQDIGNGETGHLYYLVAPATGANNVVVTVPGATTFAAESSSYTGASQTGVPDSASSGSTTGTSMTGTTTVVAAGCWLILGAESTRQVSAGASTTFRQGNTLSNGGIFDSNGPVGTGSQSLNVTITLGIGQPSGYIITSFAPAPASSPSLTLMGVGT